MPWRFWKAWRSNSIAPQVLQVTEVKVNSVSSSGDQSSSQIISPSFTPESLNGVEPELSPLSGELREERRVYQLRFLQDKVRAQAEKGKEPLFYPVSELHSQNLSDLSAVKTIFINIDRVLSIDIHDVRKVTRPSFNLPSNYPCFLNIGESDYKACYLVLINYPQTKNFLNRCLQNGINLVFFSRKKYHRDYLAFLEREFSCPMNGCEFLGHDLPASMAQYREIRPKLKASEVAVISHDQEDREFFKEIGIYQFVWAGSCSGDDSYLTVLETVAKMKSKEALKLA